MGRQPGGPLSVHSYRGPPAVLRGPHPGRVTAHVTQKPARKPRQALFVTANSGKQAHVQSLVDGYTALTYTTESTHR